MPAEKTTAVKRGRRPASESSTNVAEQILSSTEKLLRECSHLELSEKRIAVDAGVDEAMVRYYFGSKDGLLLSLMLKHCDEIEVSLQQFGKIDKSYAHPTESIFSILIEAYHSKPWILRIMFSEAIRRESMIRNRFIERFGPVGPQGLVAGPLIRLIENLQHQNIYRNDVDSFQIAINMISVVSAPLLIAPLSGHLDERLDQYRSKQWIDHLSALFNARLLSSKPKRSPPKATHR